MEPERTVPGLSGVGETTGGLPALGKHRSSTMQDILSEIQSLVERSNIINVSMTFFFIEIKHGFTVQPVVGYIISIFS